MPGSDKTRGEKGGRLPGWGRRLLCVAFWLVVWQLAAWALDLGFILPGPLEVLARLAELAATAEFWGSVALSLARIAAGFLVALVLGVGLAAVASRVRVVRELLAPVVSAMKAVPVASFVILVLMWVSSRELSVVISFLVVFPIVYTNVLAGVEATDPQLLEMADVFGVRGWARVRAVYLPEVMPYLSAAVSLGLGMAWKAGIAAEVIGLPDFSIGEHLYDAKVYLDAASLFAWTVAIVALSAVIEAAVTYALAAARARVEVRP